ncbi:MAG: NAD-dependent epimerase/dehydratase family protein [Chitinispirillaceae bacterium]|nr:NAD-dependent epimerase/dehydratase family protein [Chitinispirillaceae bacterium]
MSYEREKTIAILGCGGFIGSHLLEKLIMDEERKIIGVDIVSKKISHLLGRKNLEFYKIDINEIDNLLPILRQAGTVISLVAICTPYNYLHHPVKVIENNFISIYPIIRWCAKLKNWLIHFSTSEVYGKSISSLCNTTQDNPAYYLLNEEKSPLIMGPISAQRWCYAAAKQLTERAIFAYGMEEGLEYTIIRPFNFIGPKMDFIPGYDGEGVPRVFACFMEALLNDKPLKLVEGGKSRRCFTAIEDAVEAIMLVIKNREKVKRKILNIGNPENEITIANLANKMIEIYKQLKPEKKDFPYKLEVVSSTIFYGEGYEDSDRRVPDLTLIKEVTGWSPKIPLDLALLKSMEWFIKEYDR